MAEAVLPAASVVARSIQVTMVIRSSSRMAWGGRSQPLRELAQSLLTLVLVTGGGLALVRLGDVAGDEFSMWLIGGSGGDDFNMKMTALVAAVTVSGGPPGCDARDSGRPGADLGVEAAPARLESAAAALPYLAVPLVVILGDLAIDVFKSGIFRRASTSDISNCAGITAAEPDVLTFGGISYLGGLNSGVRTLIYSCNGLR